MGYGLGLKENTKTDKVPDEKGGVKKVKHTVTPGGAFLEGDQLGKTSRKYVIFFTSYPQRKNKLETQTVTLDLPLVALANYHATRPAYLVYTHQSLLANHCLLAAMSLGVKFDKDVFQKWRATLSDEDFKAIQEMEAITQLLFAYLANDSQ